ncbi:MAG TPA: ferredoxin [Thioploca sp.]|nr:ferredoxin [Thioploca sp.]
MQGSTVMKASDYSDYKFDLGFSNPKKSTVAEEVITDNTIPYIPTTNQEITDDEEHSLRRFHLGDPNSASEAITENYVPALLHAYRNASKIRYDYPLFLYPAEDTEIGANQLVKSAVPELWDIVELFAPGAENARILKDNLPRLERYLRETLPEGPVLAIPMLSQAGQVLQQELNLDTNNNDRFVADFNKLLDAIQPEVQLLGYGRFVAIHLLNHAISSRLIIRQADFKDKIAQYVDDLKKLLEIEWSKSDESIEPKMIRDSVGSAGDRFDPMALSEIMTHSKGSVIMSPERRIRISNILQVLEAFLQENETILVRIIHLGGIKGDWLDNNITIEASIEPEPTEKARIVFEQQSKKFAKVFKAVRIAKLELDNVYDSALHDPWFANFSWEAFSKEELLVLPVVIALESADRVAGDGMPALSRLLSSGQPVHVLIGVRAHDNPHSTNDENFSNYRFELGYFGISHRQAMVSQSSSARHEHLTEQFLLALDTTRTSLHIINTGMQSSVIHGINAWLVAGAALESRAHPFFHVNPESGDSAADRVNFAGNPQPELDWAKHKFQYKDVNDEVIDIELAFTFADYTLLVPYLRSYFRTVAIGYENEALIPIETYLSTAGWEDYKKLPFVWAVNERGELHKLVVSRSLIVACRDRLNYWHTLQELAGINNKYVDIAVQTTKTETQAIAQTELEALQATQAEQLEQARRETASETMQKLSEILLGMDLTAPIKKRSSPAPILTQKKEIIEEEIGSKEEIIEEVVEEVVFNDPWIDSDLCTSCNDCLNINGMMFIYNDSKQATLGDLNSGTYAQLVEAAEICPATCIHPGNPKDPSGMEELIKRAEPFNKL